MKSSIPNNTLSIYKTPSGAIKIEIHCIDGTSMWEIHHISLSDADALVKLLQKKLYQHQPGNWEVCFPFENQHFEDPDFEKAVQMALNHIHTRDHPPMGLDFIC